MDGQHSKFDRQKPVIDRRGAKRTQPMQVLCLGLSRSGTDSLCQALTILGIPTYHGYNLSWSPYDCILWGEAVASKYDNKGKIWTREDFDQVLGDYSACTDMPAATFVTELIQAYPEAKVILNRRPYESWRASYLKSFQPLVDSRTLAFLCHFDWSFGTRYRFWIWYLNKYFRDDFHRNARQMYDEHNALVRGAAPEGRLLEWDVTQGWEPLCEFLDKPVPEESFPAGNTVDEFFERLLSEALAPGIKRAARNASLVGVGLLAVGAVGLLRIARPGLLGAMAKRVF